MAERHATYVRSHVLRIDAASFANAVPTPRRVRSRRACSGAELAWPCAPPSSSPRSARLRRRSGWPCSRASPRARSLCSAAAAAEAQPAAAAKAESASGGASWLASGAAGSAAFPTAAATLIEAADAISLHSLALLCALSAVSVIVVTDGARSPARWALLAAAPSSVPGGLREAASLAYALHVRFSVRAAARTACAGMRVAALFHAMGFVGEETVGRPRGSLATTT